MANPPPPCPEIAYPLYVEPVELVGNALQLPCDLHLSTRFPLTFLRLLLEVWIQRKANWRDVQTVTSIPYTTEIKRVILPGQRIALLLSTEERTAHNLEFLIHVKVQFLKPQQ